MRQVGHLLHTAILVFVAGLGACSGVPFSEPAPLFVVPLAVEGEDVGGAIVDTGGGFEVLLRDTFGLHVIDTTSVVAFGGPKEVELTGPFQYQVGGLKATAENGIVEPSICNCNGLGFDFLRKTGFVLALDFEKPTVSFLQQLPTTDVQIPFSPLSNLVPEFDTSFVDVMITGQRESRWVRALLDTGAVSTVMRAGLVDESASAERFQEVTVSHPDLGAVVLIASLYDTEGIPDMIIGIDVMRVWAKNWYFQFLPRGGVVGVSGMAKTSAGEASQKSATHEGLDVPSIRLQYSMPTH